MDFEALLGFILRCFLAPRPPAHPGGVPVQLTLDVRNADFVQADQLGLQLSPLDPAEEVRDSLSAHFENTVAITADGPVALTAAK